LYDYNIYLPRDRDFKIEISKIPPEILERIEFLKRKNIISHARVKSALSD